MAEELKKFSSSFDPAFLFVIKYHTIYAHNSYDF